MSNVGWENIYIRNIYVENVYYIKVFFTLKDNIYGGGDQRKFV